MKDVTIYQTVKIGKEALSVPQRAFKNGKRQVFKNEDEARAFLEEFRAKATVKL